MAALESIAVAVVAAIGSVAGYVVKARSDKSSAQVADWSAFSAETREWTERRLAERDAAIDELRDEVKDIKSQLARLSDQYQSSLRYIITLWAGDKHDPPVEIAHDLPRPPWNRL